ncbi:oligosaccharide flippase family protein [Candidatus Roizmanbacteria bacterium]|nr:oligosaccharide flippase family protein [Candidatus Roizmanbacteria bacterium]
MKQKLLDFMNRPSSRDVLINTAGNYLNVTFTAFFALVLVRIMTPAQYGVLSVLLGIAYVLANILDFGVTAAIYSTLPNLLEAKTERVYRFIKTTFSFQSLFSFIIILILLSTFPYLDRIFFKTDAPRWVLYITAISVLFLIWQNFTLNILFASKKFLKANIYNNIQNVIKTVILLFLIYTQTITVGAVIFVFGILGPIIFFLLLFLERRDLVFVLAKSEIKREEFRFGYTLTYFFATQLFNLGGRMDLFLLSFFGLKNDVGYYGLAQKIILTIITTVVSITQVLSPSFAKAKTKKEVLYELKHGFYYLLLPAGLYALLLLTPNQVFYLFFTERFAPTATLAKMLVPAFIIFTLGSLPLQFVLYTIKRPVFVLYGNIAYFLIMTVGCYLLIPQLGVKAPPLVNIFAILAPVAVLSLTTYYGYKKLPA